MPNYVLQTMLSLARMRLKDMRVRVIPEPLLVAAANEGKNELVKIIRQARENFFEKSSTGTIAATTTPNSSSITLPSDFSEMRNLAITTASYEDIQFMFKSQSDLLFKSALIDGGSFATGHGTFYYDFYGQNSLILAPGADIALAYKMDYISTVPDMVRPDDYPAGIPAEHYDFIVTWMVTDCLRVQADPRLQAFLQKLDNQATSVKLSIASRQIKEPEYVRAYMEEEMW